MKPSYFWAKVKSVGATLGFEAMHVEGAVAEVKRAAKTNRKHFKLEIGTMCNAGTSGTGTAGIYLNLEVSVLFAFLAFNGSLTFQKLYNNIVNKH